MILDPASDYMSREVEKDSAEAKDWTKLISQLTQIGGKPTVLVAHHTRKDGKANQHIHKTSEKDLSPSLSADDIRGSGSLVQSFRWAMVLDRREYEDGSEKVFLQVVKTNYTKRSDVLQFDPDKNHGSILRFDKLLTDKDIISDNIISKIEEKQSVNNNLDYRYLLEPMDAIDDTYDEY